MEDKKSIDNEGKEKESSEENSHKTEGTVDGEEGLETTQIKEDDVEEVQIRKREKGGNEEKGHPEHKEKKKEDGMTKITDGTEKEDEGKGGKYKEKEGKKDQTEVVDTCTVEEDRRDCRDDDMKETDEERACENVNVESSESTNSRDVSRESSQKAHEVQVQEMIDKNIEDLKKSFVEILPLEEGSLQPKIQDQTAYVNMQDVTTKEQGTSSKELLSKEQNKKSSQATVTMTQTLVTEVEQTQGQHNRDESEKENLRLPDDINVEINKEEIVTEVKKEEIHTVDRDVLKGSKTEDILVTTDKNVVQAITAVQECMTAPLQSKEDNQTIQDNTKESEKLSNTDRNEGEIEMRNVRQEKKGKDEAQEMSSRGGTIQLLVKSEITTGEEQHDKETSERVENETGNKMKKENNAQDLNGKKEGRNEYENIGQQKEQMGDKIQSGSSYKEREVPEFLTQKSIEKVRDGRQQKQICTPDKTVVKSNKECKSESSETLKSTLILPAKVSDSKDTIQDIHNENNDVKSTRKPICTVFQETVPGRAKCEESFQRSETKHSRQSKETEQVHADSSLLTVTATHSQLKELEYKDQQSPQDKQVHLKQHSQEKQQTILQEDEQKQQHEQKSAAKQNVNHKSKEQIEKNQQEEQTIQEQNTHQKQNIQNGKKQEEAQQHMQLHVKGKQGVQNEQEQTDKGKTSNKEQLKYQQVKQLKELAHEKQRKLQQHEQHLKQHGKSKDQQQKQAGQDKQQMTHKQDKENHGQQKESEGDSDGAAGCGGAQGGTCPIYFGVRSYLHQFYDSNPVKNSQLYEDCTEEDDFEYAVDPIKNRCCRTRCHGFWFRAGMWGGINFILVGFITLLVGSLTPHREMIVGHHNNLEIVDRTAVAFNRRLELCLLAGLAVFCCGGVVLLFTLLVSTFLHNRGHNNNNGCSCNEIAYYGYSTTSLVEPFIAGQNQGSDVPTAAGIKIPITGQIKSVQPTLWPDIATVKEGTLMPHMP